MRGIDIIEALNDIDDKLLRDARPLKRAAPAWLKYGSLAACLCCTVLLVVLSFQWLLGGTEQPATLASGYEEPGSTPIILHSENYPLTLTVAEKYADNILVDNPIHIDFENEGSVDSENVIFAFYDHFSEDSQLDGLVWYIIPVEKDRFDYEEYEQRKNSAFAITNTILATDDQYVYTLIHSGRPDNYCYESTDYDSVYSYWLCTQESYNILGKFIVENGLEADPDWKQRFTDYTVAPVESNLAAFNETAAIEEATVTLSSSLYPVTLTIPEKYEGNVLVDNPFIDDGTVFDDGIVFKNVAFSFHTYYSEQDPSDGMVWLLIASRIEEFDLDYYENMIKGEAFQFTNTVIGTDDEYVYAIVHPGLPEYFYDISTLETTETYLQHLHSGLTILKDFVSENDLESDSDWIQIYQDLTIAPVENRLANLEYEAANPTFIHTLFSYGSVYDEDENRITNLTLACDAIDGTVLQPGDEFSFNDVVGQRTVEKGYLEAGVYSGADTETAIGGGISQVSSTLYLCCLYSDLEILERHGHIYQPNWMLAGRDAAVYWGSQDFRFKNSTDYPIRIDARVSGGRVYVNLMTTADDEKHAEIDVSSNTDGTQTTYSLTRHIYASGGNLLRTDSTERLDDMGGLGTTVYEKRDETIYTQ